ncbi:CHASE2 domain-containing protein [Marispirochaeta aestuarii]|uniref:CHASE2 domain-containing protein n=1 Tax=Marispirochaeta aestuarii TaxID=1963862 RepID=UPI0029C74606|nr:CHASE2 domain-containing protein [Marispirochaeta aestuarii]
MSRKFEFRNYYLTPLVIAVITCSLFLFPGLRGADRRIYDTFLHIKPAVKEESSLLLLDIDDLAIAQVGTWPWSRSVIADGLVLLKEFETDTVVFDIEYVDPSPRGVDSRYLEQEIPRRFREEFGELNENINALFEAILQGYIPLEEAEEYIYDLTDISSTVRDELLQSVRHVARDNDEYLGRAFSLFGNAWATVNMLPDEVELVKVGDELKSYVKEEISLKNLAVREDYRHPYSAMAIQPTIYPVISRAAGAGFPNVVVDEDGVRRRIDLVALYQDSWFGQLVFSPLVSSLGITTIRLQKGRIVLEAPEQSITIPLDRDGRMLINWPPKKFNDSFRHLSYNKLVVHDRIESQIVRNLQIMEQAGYLDFHRSEAPLADLLHYTQQLKEELLSAGGSASPDEAQAAEYRELRALLFATCADFTGGETEALILEEIDRILASPDLEDELRDEYTAVRKEVSASFEALGADVRELTALREELQTELAGSFVIIGHTGISTTDIGVNPFEKEYMNVGTHAAVANTILQGEFLDELHTGWSLLAAVLLTLILSMVIRTLSPLQSIIVSLVFILGTLGGGLLLFLFSGVYLPMLGPLIMLSLSFLTISGIKFLKTEGEKSFLRNAFSRYLSADVIKQIIDNPDRLNLGGEKKELTAVFTDIKGFSTISEQLDPTDLVKLLNQYLTTMSDTILDLKGTIDKYEGDAIIAFFGAPIEQFDHSYRACLSAVRMKRMERELNQRFMEDGMSPSPLLTRVGINTGEMVVGNMGTLQKMDYTIMGNSVNLAARLEGVNKQYGTWILMSEQTREAAGDSFAARQLDRVRVVGIHQPVRLYELIDETEHLDSNTREGLDTFHAALELFEEREWEEAEKLFRAATKLLPEDGPSGFYIERCRKFVSTPPAENWDGVFNLTLK